jgi:hypothetical protein
VVSARERYTPVLKWRQGEYQALFHLKDAVKDRVRPLIEITPPDFDFETWQPKKTIDGHLERVPERVWKKWGARPALVDTGLLDSAARMIGGEHPLTWLLDSLRAQGCLIAPVTTLISDAAYQAAVRNAAYLDKRGAALRCSLEEAADPGFTGEVHSLLNALALAPADLDLIIDLARPNFDPIDGLAQILRTVLTTSVLFGQARSLVIVATSFPATMADVTGPIQFWNRKEWLLYKHLMSIWPAAYRRPEFGDYAIASPELPQGDMRLLKPSATVRYCVDDGWIIAKGSNVRDNGFGQYRTHCAAVATSSGYLGPNFSKGSEYVHDCGSGKASTGNLSTWRWVGTNQHLTKIVDDLASFYGP